MKTDRFFCLFLALVLLWAGCRKKPAPTTTPLHWAAKTGDVHRLSSLLSGGADVNARDENGWTALHWAVQNGHRQVAQLLISGGAYVNAESKQGSTPLFLAMGEGNEDLLAMLIANGADVNALCGKNHEYPLHFAVRNGQRKTAELLIDAGADLNSQIESYSDWSNFSSPGSKCTALHEAVAAEREDNPYVGRFAR